MNANTNVNLPEGIDYKKYYSQSGMATSEFGPSLWKSLFTSVLGHYPIKIDVNNEEHVELRHHYSNLILSLPYVMPCVFCRDSFKVFLLEIKLEPFLIGRMELFYWLYLMKNLVNNKLIYQEKKCYNDKRHSLKNKYYSKMISKREYYKKITKCKNKIFKTIPSPPFIEVLDKYESLRAVCINKSKICSLPKKKT